MAKNRKKEISTEEISEATVYQDAGMVKSDGFRDEVELISNPEIVEELSEEAKKRQERALLSVRERAMAELDRRKLPAAQESFANIEKITEILNDDSVMEKVRGNVKSAMDLKFLAEAKKIELQNIQTLLRMDSVNTSGTAGEIYVGVEFGSSGGGTTKVIVGKKD